MKTKLNPSKSFFLLTSLGMIFSSCGTPLEPVPRVATNNMITHTDASYYKEGKTIFSPEKNQCTSAWDQWVTNCAYQETVRIPIMGATQEDSGSLGTLQLNFNCYSLNHQAELLVKIDETTLRLKSKPVTQKIEYRTNLYQSTGIMNVELQGNWDQHDMISQDCMVVLVPDWSQTY